MSIVYLAGVKGSGKSRLGYQLVDNFEELQLVDTFATRLPRRNTIDHGHKHITTEDFFQRVKAGQIHVHGEVTNEDYHIGVDFNTLDEMMAEGRVPLVVTRVPNVIRGIYEHYKDDHYGIFLDVDPEIAADRNFARDGFEGSFLKARATTRAERQELRRLQYKLTIEEFDENEIYSSDRIVKEASSHLREYLHR